MADNTGNTGIEIISRADAIKLGQNWYYTGEPCKYGHIDKRNMAYQCAECKREQQRELSKDPERQKQIAEYRKKHRKTKAGVDEVVEVVEVTTPVTTVDPLLSKSLWDEIKGFL